MSRVTNIATRFALIFMGIALPVLIITPFLPQLIPTGREAYIKTDMGIVEYTVGNGDIFAVQYGTIAPPSNPDEIISRHSLAWDSDGFRVPAVPSDTYSIIALGDSYTEASMVALPWSDILAQQTGQAVRNLGYRGYGPMEYAIVMEEYGVAENPDVVVVGFFGGNDISNAATFNQRADAFILPELARDAITQLTATSNPWDSNREDYQYPVYLDLQGERIPVAFLNSYVNWLNITPDDLRESANIQLIRESWQTIHALAGDDTCVVIAYFPSKPQIYLPYVAEEDRSRINVGQVQRVADPGQVIHTAPIEPSYDTLLARIPNVPLVLAEVAQEENLLFLDLTPLFAEVAATGEMLYPSYDTHWNQAGQELAGTEIARFIQANCP